MGEICPAITKKLDALIKLQKMKLELGEKMNKTMDRLKYEDVLSPPYVEYTDLSDLQLGLQNLRSMKKYIEEKGCEPLLEIMKAFKETMIFEKSSD